MWNDLSNVDLARVIGGLASRFTVNGDKSKLDFGELGFGVVYRWGLHASIPNNGTTECGSARAAMLREMDAASLTGLLGNVEDAANRAVAACRGGHFSRYSR
jgi:hypothetical protein